MVEQLIELVVDTREQIPFIFKDPWIMVTRKALPAGDYSLLGYERTVAVERKSLEDFVSTIIKDRERFRRELLILSTYDRACIVVESSLEQIMAGLYGSGASAASVFGATLSIIVDYNVPVYFCGDRQHARNFTEKYLIRCARRLERCENEDSGGMDEVPVDSSPLQQTVSRAE